MKLDLMDEKFMAKFREEAADHIQCLNEGVLELENNPDNREVVAEIFRRAHTLKGAAKMMGFADIGELAHKVEDLLECVNDGQVALSEDVTNLLFTAFDTIELMVKTTTDTNGCGVDTEALREKLAAAGETGKKREARSNADGKQAQRKSKGKSSGRAIRKQKPPEKTVGLKKTAKTGEPGSVRTSTKKLDELVNLAGEMALIQIEANRRLSALKPLVRLGREQEQLLADSHVGAEAWSRAAANDEDGAGARLRQIANDQKRITDDLFSDYDELTARQDRVVGEIEKAVMGLRMIPVSRVFDTFPRAVRDLAKRFNKQINLKIAGGETQLDRRMLEQLKDPLAHVVRNAVDHGIEAPDDRRKNGKAAEGTITLSAAQEGDQVVIEVSDDGAGIDTEVVKVAAVKKGLVSEAEAASMSHRELTQLTFEPGFSTAKKLTDVSGRGVGLDVVKKNIEELKGSYDVVSERGQSTRVSLKVPLTLAVTQVLIVDCCGEAYALPTAAIERSTRISLDEVFSVGTQDAVRFDDRIVPVTRLSSLIGCGGSAVPGSARAYLVLVKVAADSFGLLVDDIVCEEEIVIKNLGNHIRSTRLIAGTTIRNGDVVPILHLQEIVGSAQLARSGPTMQRHEEVKPEATSPSILVIDDSFTTRELEESILQSSGYVTDGARDGVDALEMLGKKRYDLLVVDVKMPRMDGFSFAAKVRGDDNLRDIPIIFVTGEDKPEDKRRGIELGEAYIVKGDFEQQNLLDSVKRLIDSV